MSYVAIWLQACLHWRCAYFQTLSWNETIFVVDWDILYKLCGSANKWSKGFVFSGKIWWQFFSCNKACSKYRTLSTTTPKYTLTQRLVWIENPFVASVTCSRYQMAFKWSVNFWSPAMFSIRWNGKYFNEWNFYLDILRIQENWVGWKFHNELACVFTAHYASKNADWNQQQLTGWRRFGQSEQRKSSELFPTQLEKSPDSGFFACDL